MYRKEKDSRTKEKMGNRKKIAKFLMRTSASRSTFLYAAN
jgi:hypothetical protein